jgi:antitoxin (DNA-binding transcriptional repressor) of toxin-antitoxin stability system
MDAVAHGEAFIVTRNGTPIGELIPLRRHRHRLSHGTCDPGPSRCGWRMDAGPVEWNSGGRTLADQICRRWGVGLSARPWFNGRHGHADHVQHVAPDELEAGDVVVADVTPRLVPGAGGSSGAPPLALDHCATVP